MNKSPELRRLTVVNLRGAVARFDLAFEPGRTLTIVYGDNGTGKSTICDAFDVVGNGTVGSLNRPGIGRKQDYWPSLGQPATNIAVTLEASDGTCEARVLRKDVVISGATRPRVVVFRRSQILDVVDVADGDRYKAIQPFIDVSFIETCEASLLAAAKDVNSRLGDAATRIDEQRESIGHYWANAGSPGRDALAWAEREVARDRDASATEIKRLEAARARFAQVGEATDAVETAERARAEAEAALATARARLEEVTAAASAGAADLVTLLEAASRHLAAHPAPEVCPLCESSDAASGLADRVAGRLATFALVRDARSTLETRQRELDTASRRLSQALSASETATRDLDTALARNDWPSDVARPAADVPTDAAARRQWLASNEHLTEDWRRASATRESANSVAGALARAWKAYADNVAAQRDLDAVLPRLRRAHEIVCEERKRFTDAILEDIAAEVGRLYEAVHPGEGHEKISLALDPKRRASLSMGASFLGEDDVPPAAYLSESHLDTLGLCLFLALAVRAAPAETILVLDDPLGSVDAPHAERAIEMLYDEAARFRHCVITTHYRPWREKYRWGRLKTGDCQFVELTKWSATSGMTVVGTVPELERLRAALESPHPDPGAVCGKAGVVLEAALDFLTTQYRCAVPRNAEGRYTLDELLSAINGKLRQALAVETLGKDQNGVEVYTKHALGPRLDALTQIVKMRNLGGCHFNELSHEHLDDDFLEFGRQVRDLLELLTDDGAWPKHDKSGSYWSTRGGKRRLHPLKKPS